MLRSKRLMAMFLCLVMLVSMLPVSAMAEEPAAEETEAVHEHDYQAVVTDPTCTERGYTTYTCTCGESYVDDYTDPLNHPETVTLAGYNADCTTAGLTDGLQCAVCGEVLQEQEEIPALGHQPVHVEEVPATMTSTGATAGSVCSVCGEVLEGLEEIPILEAAPAAEPVSSEQAQNAASAEENQKPVQQEAAPTAEGTSTQSAGGQPAVAQSDPDKVRVYFTLTPENAELTVYAAVKAEDGETLTVALDKNGEAIMIEPEEDGSYLLLPGEYLYSLAANGFVIIEKEKLRIDASDEPVGITLELELSPDGKDEEPITVEVTGESVSSWAKNSNVTASGTCGENLSWALDDEGTLIITGTGTMDNFDYYGPWYDNRSTINRIVVEEGVSSIGSEAFFCCEAVESIQLPSTLRTIGTAAFYGMTNLENFVIPDSVTSIGANAFERCKSITEIVFPYGIQVIDISLLFECVNLNSVSIPETVTRINSAAFGYCTSLESITIPASVTEIEGRAFTRCDNLKEVVFLGDVPAVSYTNYGLPFDLDQAKVLYKCSYSSWEENAIRQTIGTKLAWEPIHAWGEGVVTKQATFDEEGEIVYTCKNNTAHTRKEIFPCLEPVSGSCGDDLTWRLDRTGKLTVSGTGAIEDYTSSDEVPWSIYNYLIQKVEIGPGVASIGDNAFIGCTGISVISLTGNMPTISDHAFVGVTSLMMYPKRNSTYAVDKMVNYGGLLTWMAYGSENKDIRSGFCGDNLSWVLDDEGLLTISGSGEMRDYSSSNTPWYDFRYEILHLIVEEGVLRIGDNAFYDCSLDDLSLPSSLVSIGNAAFQQSGLNQISLPENIKSIGNFAFADCSTIEKIVFPSSLEFIGADAFYGCSALEEVLFPDTDINIDGGLFYGCRHLVSAGPLESDCNIKFGWTKTIPDNAFANCTELRSISLPDSIETIGEFAFYSCSSLQYLDLPASVRDIGRSAFYFCESLFELDLPANIKEIKDNLFSYCESLTSFVIPYGVVSIGEGAFLNCINLTSVTIPDSVTEIGADAFSVCSDLKNIVIPKGVITVGTRAFYDCDSMLSVTIPACLMYAERAFEDCDNVVDVYYGGTETSRSIYLSNILPNAVWHYTEQTGIPDVDRILTLYCSPITVNTPGTVTITAVIADYPAAVQEVGLNFRELATGHMRFVSMTQQPDGTWKAEIDVNEYQRSTRFELYSMYYTDNAGNSPAFYGAGCEFYSACVNGQHIIEAPEFLLPPQFADLSFEVINNGVEDVTAPELVSLSINSSVHTAVSPVVITIEAEDDFSGLRDAYITLGIDDESGYHTAWGLYAESPADERTFKVEYQYDFNQQNYLTYYIDLIEIYDELGNRSCYYSKLSDQYEEAENKILEEDVSKISFTVFTEVKAPSISSASLKKNGVSIVWGAVEEAPRYRVFRKASGDSDWTQLKDVAGTSYMDTTCSSGTKYTYAVCCVTEDGGYELSPQSTSKSVTYIAAPALKSVSNVAGGLKISWGKVDGAAKYRVFRKTGSGGWAKLADTTAVTYTDKSGKAGTKYTYTVRCISSDGKTFTSAYDTTGKTGTWFKLATPAISSVSNKVNGVLIKWGKVSGAEKYRVYRKTSSSGWSAIGDVTGTSFTDKTRKLGTTYTYTVRCVSGNGKTMTSNYNGTGKTIKADYALARPVISSLTNTKNGVVVKWGKVSGAEKYRIYRKTSSGSWKALGDVTGNSYTDKSAAIGTTYTYTVRCVSKDGKTMTSNFNSGKTIKAAYALKTPALSSATAAAGKVTVKWGKVSGADKYRVYRKTGSGGWKAIGDVTGASFVDKNVKKGTTYTYTVRCVSSDGKRITSGYDSTGKTVKAK